jgi:hypothetical protein
MGGEMGGSAPGGGVAPPSGGSYGAALRNSKILQGSSRLRLESLLCLLFLIPVSFSYSLYYPPLLFLISFSSKGWGGRPRAAKTPATSSK